tara:strand:+ start:35 stop:937 length:903 start_codon:yes stop_codon:yes gene_type:complete
MAALEGYPTDISLPAESRFYTFVEVGKSFNSNYDITWSFQYKLPSSSFDANNTTFKNYQLGFSTFLTNLPRPLSCLPGQFLGDQDPEYILSAYSLLTEAEEVLKTEANSSILLEGGILSGMLVKVAFDSTGRYALTGRDDRPGVKAENVLRESIVARDFLHNVIAYNHLSSVSTTFSTISTDTYRTLRFRYANLGQTLYIDSRESDTTTYTLLTALKLGTRYRSLSNIENIYCGFSFSTPISATLPATAAAYNLSAKDFFLRNFHVEGYEGSEVLTETILTPSLSSVPNTVSTTVTNITA